MCPDLCKDASASPGGQQASKRLCDTPFCVADNDVEKIAYDTREGDMVYQCTGIPDGSLAPVPLPTRSSALCCQVNPAPRKSSLDGLAAFPTRLRSSSRSSFTRRARALPSARAGAARQDGGYARRRADGGPLTPRERSMPHAGSHRPTDGGDDPAAAQPWIRDPACGRAGFLVAAGEILRERGSEIAPGYGHPCPPSSVLSSATSFVVGASCWRSRNSLP
jgi:hypothetical protein